MGWYFETSPLSPDLNTGLMLDIFHSAGKQPVDREQLNGLQREELEVFLNTWEEIPSGPVDVLTLRELRCPYTSSSVHSILESSGCLSEGEKV